MQFFSQNVYFFLGVSARSLADWLRHGADFYTERSLCYLQFYFGAYECTTFSKQTKTKENFFKQNVRKELTQTCLFHFLPFGSWTTCDVQCCCTSTLSFGRNFTLYFTGHFQRKLTFERWVIRFSAKMCTLSWSIRTIFDRVTPVMELISIPQDLCGTFKLNFGPMNALHFQSKLRLKKHSSKEMLRKN